MIKRKARETGVELLRRYSNLPGLSERLRRVERSLAHLPARRRRRPARRTRYKLDQRLEAATVAQLVAEYQAGAPSTELMQQYRLSKASVLKLLDEAGVTRRRQGLTGADVERAARLYASGLSLVQVADRLGRPMSTVYRGLRHAGVVMRPSPGIELRAQGDASA